jgi:hypothetical protein
MDSSTLNQFATRYTAAWCSQHAASVASFFGEQGSLKINDGAPAIGRTAITNSAQGFMTAFPDLVVKMDRLVVSGAKTEYHWALMGTNTGPGGTGKFVRISGYEEWRFGPDGLIAESLGHFDAADYQRQLNAGGPSEKIDAGWKPVLKIAVLCICVLAACLGVISLGAGLHRVSLTQTCASAASACIIANSLWPYRMWQVGGVALSVAAIGAFFLGIR